jgi:hypothetical protein
LSDFDEVFVRVAGIGADFTSVVFGFGEELGALGSPLLVDCVDIGYFEGEHRLVGDLWHEGGSV